MTSDLEIEEPMLDKLPKLSQIQQTSQRFNQYVATITVSLGAFCAGTVLSWTSSALPYILPQFQNVTEQTSLATNGTSESSPGFTITHQQEALVGALLTVGALVSAIPTGYCADKFGRRLTVLALGVPFLLNWMLIALASNVHMLLLARFLAGIGVGGICVAAPMYIGEIAEAAYRGVFGSFFQMFLCCGILFTCVVGSFTNWVGLSLVLGAIPIIFVITFYFMSETPVYLVKNNHLEQAEKVLKDFRGSNYDVASELKTIEREIQKSHEQTVTISEIFKNKAYIRALLSVIGVLAFQQLSGINAIIFYTVPIFEAAGSTMSPTLAAVIINLVQVIVAYISIMIIERANRKFYLMLSSLGMMLCLTSLGMYFHIKMLELNISSIDFLPVASTVIFMIAFAIGYGPVPWMLISELFAPEIKGIASGVAVLANWIFAFIVTFCFPLMNKSLGGHVTFYIFASIMGVATMFVHFVVPETRGKSLSEIQNTLRGQK